MAAMTHPGKSPDGVRFSSNQTISASTYALGRRRHARLPYAQRMPSKRIDSLSGKGQPGELALLRRIRSRAGRAAGATLRLGIGDDCALLRPHPGEELAVTTDLSIAGRHFRLDWHPPESIGHRALARGLSDLAAMGARPIAAFLSLGLPRELTTAPASRPAWPTGFVRQKSSTHNAATWMDAFLDGLLALTAAYKTPLAGGDLSESSIPIADIVLIGRVLQGKALLRSTARPGYLLYVTGALGGAAAALARLAQLAEARPAGSHPLRIPRKLEALLAPHLYPQPRVRQGLWLVRHSAASAAIDLSDGLSTDLAHLCRESGVAAEVEADLVPIHPAATLAQALHGGEDYELLFTAPPTARLPRKIAGVAIARIGRIVKLRPGRPAVTLITPQGAQPLEPRGWEHFS
jgi:thiamine-monophosphate kinase